MRVTHTSVDAHGVKHFSVISDYLGGRTTVVRVLEPKIASATDHRLLYVLPVEPGVTTEASSVSDGLEELRRLDVQNRYNVTIIAPSFNISPWYGDNVSDPRHRIESFIVHDLVSFGDTFSPPGHVSQRWLLGFSKSGFGALALIFRHPNVFAMAAAWDAPAQLKDMSIGMGIASNFGTEANFATYRIPTLIALHADAFSKVNRLWIGADDSSWTPHMLELHRQLEEAGVLHTFARGGVRLVHAWYSGWLESAVRALAEQSASLAALGVTVAEQSALPNRISVQ
jgi:S-formylglutathione hydrolase FrmB